MSDSHPPQRQLSRRSSHSQHIRPSPYTMMDLDRFVRAQNGIIGQPSLPVPHGLTVTRYEHALMELWAGRVVTFWVWWVFPHIFGYGGSPFSRFFGIKTQQEAEAYLADSILAPRLRQAIDAVLANTNIVQAQQPGSKTTVAAELIELFGGEVKQVARFRACLTLFAQVAMDEPRRYFLRALEATFGGRQCTKTLDILLQWTA